MWVFKLVLTGMFLNVTCNTFKRTECKSRKSTAWQGLNLSTYQSPHMVRALGSFQWHWAETWCPSIHTQIQQLSSVRPVLHTETAADDEEARNQQSSGVSTGTERSPAAFDHDHVWWREVWKNRRRILPHVLFVGVLGKSWLTGSCRRWSCISNSLPFM